MRHPAKPLHPVYLFLVCTLALGLAANGCSCGSETGTNNGDGGDTDGANNLPDGELPDGGIDPCTVPGAICFDGSTPEDSGVPGCFFKPCVGQNGKQTIYQCGDCIDNDGDGFIDDADPNCLGACDNNEAGLELLLSGSPLSGCKRDCYYDFNSGAGNDNCHWALQCDPKTPVRSCCDPNRTELETCGAARNRVNCTDPQIQDPVCHEICMPMVPNGCDCFGCCDIRTTATPEAEHWVYLGSFSEDASGTKVGTCNIEAAKAGDNEACRLCTPQENCVKGCGECQLCLGKTELPDHCNDPEERCPGGEQACGLPGDPSCPLFHFCLTGCCVFDAGR
jgi:hypothetical protein